MSARESSPAIEGRNLSTWQRAWFQGTVRRINEDGTVAIDYDGGDVEERVPREYACREEEERALLPPATDAHQTSSGRRRIAPERLSAEMLASPQYGKRSSATVESAPKRKPQDRKEAPVSPSCVRDLRLAFEGEEEQQQQATAETAGQVELVGVRIRVLWTVEKAWFAGRVVSATRGDCGIVHTVDYDDGERATHHLQSAESALNETCEIEPTAKCKTSVNPTAPKQPPPVPPKPTEESSTPPHVRLLWHGWQGGGDRRRPQEAVEQEEAKVGLFEWPSYERWTEAMQPEQLDEEGGCCAPPSFEAFDPLRLLVEQLELSGSLPTEAEEEAWAEGRGDGEKLMWYDPLLWHSEYLEDLEPGVAGHVG